MPVRFGVLGVVAAWSADGEPLALRGPRHRAVLARLLVARGRVVPLGVLVDDLWSAPPPGAVGAVRTFVGALRLALEPERPARAPSRLLVTEGPGYALRPAPEAVDADRFERTVRTAGSLPAPAAAVALGEALAQWRGPAYADVADEGWARAEQARLGELRLQGVELLARARVRSGEPAHAVPDLDAHVTEHPWREDAWELLALALYRSGRQAEALDVLRRARALLTGRLGLDPGAGLTRLESDILQRSPDLDADEPTGPAAPAVGPGADPPPPWTRAATVYEQTVAIGARARLASTVDLLRSLAVTGGAGLVAAREQRLASVVAAERTGDPVLAGRVIGGYDVPSVWARADDPAHAAQVVAAAERTLRRLGPEAPAPVRARLLATVAVESRGLPGQRGREAALAAERIARDLGDPAVLAFALDGVLLHTFHRAGLAAERAAIGAELVALAQRHALGIYEVLGHLARVQALAALGDLAGADADAAAADRLAEQHESPLTTVFTTGYRAMRLAATGHAPASVAASYRAWAAPLEASWMPGVTHGLLPLALLALDVHPSTRPAVDRGPYEPWARTHLLLARGRTADASRALRAQPEPPPDHMLEALWVLTARAALALGDRDVMSRARESLGPARDEMAAGSGLLTLGRVRVTTDALDRVLAGSPG